MNRPEGSLRLRHGRKMGDWLTPRRLMIAAIVFHLLVTTTLFTVGRFALLPGTFDADGLGSFAPDSLRDRPKIVELSNQLTRNDLNQWITVHYPFHLKIYSICFAVFGRLVGFNIIAVEPLNILCYILSLIFVFKLGAAIFDRRAGLIASAVVALWPSILLHTTQFLRDPLFLAGTLSLILIEVNLLSPKLSWRVALLDGVIGGLVNAFLWLIRDNMGELVIAIGFLGLLTLVARQLIERRVLIRNMAGLILLIAIGVLVGRVMPRFRDPLVPPRTAVAVMQNDQPALETNVDALAAVRAQGPVPRWDLATRVIRNRAEFIRFYPDAVSSIDRDVTLKTRTDLVRYLPRAAVIGLFAPFPDMWFRKGGHVGTAGRLVSGLETVAMYLVETLAVVGLWLGRRRFSVWFLFAVIMMGTVALGMVVVNVGALYRLRYIFLILIILLAARGTTQLLDWHRHRKQRLKLLNST